MRHIQEGEVGEIKDGLRRRDLEWRRTSWEEL
jgi:hypothetical protein